MKIQSVSLVSNRNYGQSFGVSKRKSDENVSYETSPIRGKLIVPLAATILAMNSSYATNAYNVNFNDNDNIENVIQSNSEKIILKGNFKNASSGGATALIELVSDDGNDSDAETLNVIFISNQRYGKQVDGKRIVGERQVVDLYRPNSIIKTKVYAKENGKEVFKYDTYYLQGDLSRTRKAMSAVDDPNIILEPTYRRNFENEKKQISEEFYNFLEQNFSKRLQKITDKEVIENKDDEDNVLDIIIGM